MQYPQSNYERDASDEHKLRLIDAGSQVPSVEEFEDFNSLAAAHDHIYSVVDRMDLVMQAAVDHAVSLTSADGAALQIHEGQGKMLRASAGLADDYTGSGALIKASLVSQCIQSALPQYIPDRRREPGVNQATADKLVISSILLIPVLLGHEAVGILLAVSRVPDAFGPADENSLVLVAGMVGTAVAYAAAADARATLKREREKASGELQESRYLYLTSINALHEGYTVIDRDGTILNCNAAAENILRISADQLIGHFIGSIAPSFVLEDGRVMPASEHPVWLALTTGRTQSTIIGLTEAAAPTVWLSVSACPLFHADAAEPYGAVQIFHDITEQLAAALELKKSEERLREAQRTAGIGCWELEVASNTYWMSEEMYRIYDMAAEPIPPTETSLRTIVHPDDVSMRDEAMCRTIEQGVPFDFDYRLVMRDGRIKWCHGVGRPVFDGQGAVVKITGTSLDITNRKLIEQKLVENSEALAQQKEELELANSLIQGANKLLRTLVVEDGMTGLKNHRAFQEKIADEVVRAKRHKNSLSLLMMDVDRFKLYNDTFGHPEGDLVLQTVAELILANKRETDTAARYGGEEFAVILPNTDAAGAAVIAERIRAAVEIAPWPRTNITISIGICALTNEIPCAKDMIAAADIALYDSKSQGRNCISIFPLEENDFSEVEFVPSIS